MNELPPSRCERDEPRASRIALPGLPGVRAEFWMGGSQSLVGEPITPADLRDALVIDCAGDLPRVHRAAAGRYLPCVFLDTESEQHGFTRVAGLVHELATAISAPAAAADLPPRIFVFCQYGLNRSGLVTGLLLRALGASSEAAVGSVRLARPGALNNLTFGRLIAEWRCPLDDA